jgi:hypothetical protein
VTQRTDRANHERYSTTDRRRPSLFFHPLILCVFQDKQKVSVRERSKQLGHYISRQHLNMAWCCLLLVGLLFVARSSNSWTIPATTTYYYNRSPCRLGWRMEEKKGSSTKGADHDETTVVQGVVEASTSTSVRTSFQQYQQQQLQGDNESLQSSSCSHHEPIRQLHLPGTFVSELQKLDNLPWNTNGSNNSKDAKRVFHGRGGCFGADCEHLTLDWYPPVWVLTSFGVDLSHPFQAEVASILMGSNITNSTTKTTTEMGQNVTSHPSIPLNLVY